MCQALNQCKDTIVSLQHAHENENGFMMVLKWGVQFGIESNGPYTNMFNSFSP